MYWYMYLGGSFTVGCKMMVFYEVANSKVATFCCLVLVMSFFYTQSMSQRKLKARDYVSFFYFFVDKLTYMDGRPLQPTQAATRGGCVRAKWFLSRGLLSYSQ